MELAAAPRELFAERFALLYAEAGNPPLKRVTESVARARAVDERGRPVLVPAQRISDWRRGRNVPARFAGLATVLGVLIGEARKRRRQPVVAKLYDIEAWQAIWEAAIASPITGGGHAPAVSPGPRTESEVIAVCPYRGLSAFGQSDSGWFFGRERSTNDLRERLRQAGKAGGFVVLVGASGAGKSSLLRAGLGLRLEAGTLSDEQDVAWPIVAMTPGAEPLEVLGRRIEELAGPLEDAAMTTAFDDGVRRGARDSAERACGPGAGMVLIVDQFEESFTLCRDEDTRLLFLRALHAICTPFADGAPAPGLVVLGVRADFYDRCLAYPEIVEAMQDRQMALGAMSANEVRDAVVRPAKAVGLQLEAGLVELMLADLGATVHRAGGKAAAAAAGYEAGALPLLSHALLATWQRRQGGKLTVAGYRSAGGINGAVAATAERAWDGLDDAGKAAARTILLHLVQVGDTTRDVRKRSTRAELVDDQGHDAAAAEQALEVLAGARLVTLDADSVEITHEALLEAWPRLRSWIDDNRAGNLARQRLESDAATWEEQDRDASLLYRGARLESTERLVREADSVGPSPVAKDFLAVSAQHLRRTRWLRRSAVALVCVFALIAAGAAAVAINERDEAEFRQVVIESDHMLASDPSLSAQLDLVAHGLRPDDPGVRARVLDKQHAPLATSLRGHDAAVYLTSFSPDGKLLATASEDKTVRLWRIPESGMPTPLGKPLTGHTSWVSTAVFGPDGETLATAGDDGTVRLWDVSDPAEPQLLGAPLSGRNGSVYLVAFSPDGKTLATANNDQTVRLWDVSDPAAPERLGKPLSGHDAAVRSVAFAPDGKTLASGSDDHTVRLWDVREPAKATPVGEPLAGAEDMVHSVAFSPDGDTLAVGVEDTTVRLWDVGDPAAAHPIGQPLAGHEGLVWSVAFSPDGRTLASGSADGTTRLWNVADPAHAAPIGRPLSARSGTVYAVAFSPDGRKLAAGSDDKTVRLWSLPGGVLPAHSVGVSAVAVAPGGELLATGGADHRAQLWRIKDGKRAAAVGKPLTGQQGVVRQLDFGPRGDLLAVASTDNTVRLWSVRDPAKPERLGQPLTGGRGYFSPDGKLLVIIDEDQLRGYDVGDPDRPVALPPLDTGHSAYITSGAFSPDGTTFATGSFDKTTKLWDVTAPAKPKQRGKDLAGHDGPVWDVAFRPDGRALATASGDTTIRLWDTADPNKPKPLGEALRGHSDAVNTVAFSPDGSRLVSGSHDRTVRVWRMPDLPPSAALDSHTGVVEDAAFTPDGRTVVTGSADGTVRLWSLDELASIRRICSVTGGMLNRELWERYVPQLSYDPPC